jgi:hypothetical protein
MNAKYIASVIVRNIPSNPAYYFCVGQFGGEPPVEFQFRDAEAAATFLKLFTLERGELGKQVAAGSIFDKVGYSTAEYWFKQEILDKDIEKVTRESGEIMEEAKRKAWLEWLRTGGTIYGESTFCYESPTGLNIYSEILEPQTKPSDEKKE